MTKTTWVDEMDIKKRAKTGKDKIRDNNIWKWIKKKREKMLEGFLEIFLG